MLGWRQKPRVDESLTGGKVVVIPTLTSLLSSPNANHNINNRTNVQQISKLLLFIINSAFSNLVGSPNQEPRSLSSSLFPFFRPKLSTNKKTSLLVNHWHSDQKLQGPMDNQQPIQSPHPIPTLGPIFHPHPPNNVPTRIPVPHPLVIYPDRQEIQRMSPPVQKIQLPPMIKHPGKQLLPMNGMQSHPVLPMSFDHTLPLHNSLPGTSLALASQPQPSIASLPDIPLRIQPNPLSNNDAEHQPNHSPPSTESMEFPSSKVNQKNYNSEEVSWVPTGPINMESQNHIVLAHINSSSPEMMASSEALPTSLPLIREPPQRKQMGFSRRPGRPHKKPHSSSNRLEELKQGFYGIIFGRKGPPRPPAPPPPPPAPLSPPLPAPPTHPLRAHPPPTQWSPVAEPSRGESLTSGREGGNHVEDITCKIFTNDVCLDVNEYPSEAILGSVLRNRPRFLAMYADVSDLFYRGSMDGVSPEEETAYDTQHYYGTDNTHSIRDYAEDGGYICPSEVVYVRPKRGRNVKGEWKYVINLPEFPQTLRLERCLKPQSKCSYVFPHLESECVQLLNMQRLIVWTPQKGPHVDVLKMPSGCTCHLIPVRNTNDADQGLSETGSDVPINSGDADILTESQSISVVSNPEREEGKNTDKYWKDDNDGKNRPHLLGPYGKHRKPSKKTKGERPHSTFGRPKIIEYGGSPRRFDDGRRNKINLNHHPIVDYLRQPWQ